MLKARPALGHSLQSEIDALAGSDSLRSLEVPSGIDLSSNDYLGLSKHPALRESVTNALRSGARIGATGSRLLSGHAREWGELEQRFAEFAGTEAALFFSSGYTANLGLLSAALRRGDIVFSDALNHASLIDGMRLSGATRVIYPHRDVAALEEALREHATRDCRKLIVTESVFSMDGDLAPLAEIAALAERYGAGLVVDEAHALGVFGPEGRGRVAALGLTDRVFAIVYPCGKALASAGAAVCGSAVLQQYLINRARTFLFNTALPPYFASQISAALRTASAMDAERARLFAMADKLRVTLREARFHTGASASQIIPVILGENAVALHYAGQLARAGFAARAIRPPTVPAGTARLRLSLSCTLGDSELARLTQSLVAIRERSPEALHASATANT